MRLLLIAFIACFGCAKAAWVEHPISTAPDRSCRVGVEAVTDYYIWECLNNEHIVISQFGNYFGPYKAKREVTKCGELTASEQKTDLSPASCKAPSSNFSWNASVNKRGKVRRFD